MKKSKRPVSEFWNLLYCHPEIASQWDYEANAPHRPEEVTPGSSKAFQWKCANNEEHTWIAKVNVRSKGHGCPICSGRVASKENSLAACEPQLTKEWHPTENYPYTPENTSRGSKRKITWVCSLGHEFRATVNNRVANGSGCPRCARHGMSRVELRVATELMKLFPGAQRRKKVFGKECDVFLPELKIGIEIDGHYWHTGKKSEEIAKTLALLENGVTVIRMRDDRLERISDSDVFFKYRENEADMVCRLATKISEICFDQGHFDAAKVLREYAYEGRLIADDIFSEWVDSLPAPPPGESFKDLAPEAAAQWDDERNGAMRPELFRPHSSFRAHWKCPECDHRWQVSIGSRTAGNGCPACAGRVATETYNIQVLCSHLMHEWNWQQNDVDPRTVTPMSARLFSWKCLKRGHVWEASAYVRTNGQSCPECRAEEDSLLVRCPDVAATWHPTKNGDITPSDVSYGSKREFWWMCLENTDHVWKRSVNIRTSNRGCPFCAGKRVSPETSLAARRPDLAAQWDFDVNGALTPESVTAGSNLNVGWVCERGHRWIANINSRNRGNGCPGCRSATPDMPLDERPATRSEAIARGISYYFTGKPCTHGHISWRRTSNKNCQECSRLRSSEYHRSGTGRISEGIKTGKPRTFGNEPSST
ncbi:hypothetical protein LCM28_13370 [Salipiger pacificus]|nr:hypothetical protein [Alloyangia pacifica]